MWTLLDDWNAYYDTRPGEPPTLRVFGTIQFPTPGWTWSFEQLPPGVSGREVRLRVTATPPAGMVTQVVTDVGVAWAKEVLADQVAVVQVKGEGTNGRTMQVLPVS